MNRGDTRRGVRWSGRFGLPSSIVRRRLVTGRRRSGRLYQRLYLIEQSPVLVGKLIQQALLVVDGFVQRLDAVLQVRDLLFQFDVVFVRHVSPRKWASGSPVTTERHSLMAHGGFRTRDWGVRAGSAGWVGVSEISPPWHGRARIATFVAAKASFYRFLRKGAFSWDSL